MGTYSIPKDRITGSTSRQPLERTDLAPLRSSNSVALLVTDGFAGVVRHGAGRGFESRERSSRHVVTESKDEGLPGSESLLTCSIQQRPSRHRSGDGHGEHGERLHRVSS